MEEEDEEEDEEELDWGFSWCRGGGPANFVAPLEALRCLTRLELSERAVLPGEGGLGCCRVWAGQDKAGKGSAGLSAGPGVATAGPGRASGCPPTLTQASALAIVLADPQVVLATAPALAEVHAPCGAPSGRAFAADDEEDERVRRRAWCDMLRDLCPHVTVTPADPPSRMW